MNAEVPYPRLADGHLRTRVGRLRFWMHILALHALFLSPTPAQEDRLTVLRPWTESSPGLAVAV